MPRKWSSKKQSPSRSPSGPPNEDSDSSTPSSGNPTGTSLPFARRLSTPPAPSSGTAGSSATSASAKPRPTFRSRSRAGGLVPLEKAAGSGRLPALNPSAARTSDISRRFKAVIGGRPRPAKEPTTVFGSPSKYRGDDEE